MDLLIFTDTALLQRIVRSMMSVVEQRSGEIERLPLIITRFRRARLAAAACIWAGDVA